MSCLIIGGTKDERKEKAVEISNSQFLIPKERAFARISNFDTILVEGETSIGIQQIRELEHKLNLRPYNSPYKSAIIHPGELLTIEAQNALLKTLEEPSESSILILTAPQIDALLPTVVSRCQIIKLPSKLEIILSQEDINSIIHDLSSIIQSGVGERLKFASRLGKKREEIKIWLEMQIFFWREILLGKVGARVDPQYVNMLTRCKEGLKFLTARQIIKIIKSLEKTWSEIEQNVNPRLALEVFLLNLPYQGKNGEFRAS